MKTSFFIMMGGNAGHAAKAYADLLMQLRDEELDRIIGKENLRQKIHLICLCGDARANLSAFIDLLTESVALRKAMCSGKVPVPEAEIDFTSNLRQTIQEMVSSKPSSNQT